MASRLCWPELPFLLIVAVAFFAWEAGSRVLTLCSEALWQGALLPPRLYACTAWKGMIGLSATGPPQQVIDSIVAGAKDLHTIVEGVLGCGFAMEKTCLVASSKHVGEQVSSRLADLCPSHSSTAVNLGVDYTAGRALRVGGRSAKLKARIAAAGRKATRLKKQNKALKRSAIIKVFFVGPVSGSELWE
eukprot:9481253-Pyramimonas_sp.AAC.1